MKFADLNINQIDQLIAALKEQIPALNDVSFRMSTATEHSGGRRPISLWGSWKIDHELCGCAHGIYAGGNEECEVTDMMQRFMDDYRRAVEILMQKKSSEIGELLREIELEIPTPITGEDMAAIAAPAKEAA